MAERIDSASKLIAALPAVIYQTFASPEALETWLPPEGMTGTMLAFRFCEGGMYRMRLTCNRSQHSPGKTSEDADEVTVAFLKIVPNERIEQAVLFVSDDPAFAGEMRMTWTFEPTDNGTRVMVRCTNVLTGIEPADHRAGLNATLDNLAAYIAA
ncbi:MAG: hypothetical protein RLZZ387_4097 [Chloroflexota bacterium]|jgi:uncharacterized protein YndB with AHSA1/START domain